MKSFEARYGGRCALCDDPIDPGDDCTYFEDEVCHWDCALEEGE
jgi:hypothetical protein